MSLLAAAYTDRGNTKESNQDSLCIKEAKTAVGNIIMAVLCDGMGGLDKGELASSHVILQLSKWFEEELPKQIMLADYIHDIKLRWNEILREANRKISEYGKENKIQLGTTVTVVLVIHEEKYLIGHIGDSRAYLLDDSGMFQLTEDQTLVASEVRAGRLAPEAAEVDPRRNVLLQCVGASDEITPAIYEGSIQWGNIVLICSDGFRHKISKEEMYSTLRPGLLEDEREMEDSLKALTETVKDREETDNITSVLIKII